MDVCDHALLLLCPQAQRGCHRLLADAKEGRAMHCVQQWLGIPESRKHQGLEAHKLRLTLPAFFKDSFLESSRGCALGVTQRVSTPQTGLTSAAGKSPR